jgi:hypothetical protein
VLGIQFILGRGSEVFVVIVVSRNMWHIDARRFLTSLKVFGTVNRIQAIRVFAARVTPVFANKNYLLNN